MNPSNIKHSKYFYNYSKTEVTYFLTGRREPFKFVKSRYIINKLLWMFNFGRKFIFSLNFTQSLEGCLVFLCLYHILLIWIFFIINQNLNRTIIKRWIEATKTRKIYSGLSKSLTISTKRKKMIWIWNAFSWNSI